MDVVGEEEKEEGEEWAGFRDVWRSGGSCAVLRSSWWVTGCSEWMCRDEERE